MYGGITLGYFVLVWGVVDERLRLVFLVYLMACGVGGREGVPAAGASLVIPVGGGPLWTAWTFAPRIPVRPKQGPAPLAVAFYEPNPAEEEGRRRG